jgi:purine-binding chemotaxis protein CheW
MDFLKIRRKAKERAARAAAAPAAEKPVTAQSRREVAELALGGDAAAPPAPTPPTRPSRASPGSPEAQRVEAEMGSRVAALPHTPDARFVTWRPDGGAPPALPAIGPPEGEYLLPAPEPARMVVHADPLEEFLYRSDEAGPGPGSILAAVEVDGLPAPAALEEYLTFRLAGESYAVEIGRVLEVLRTPPITEVPRAPDDVLGIISVRGEVITVVDPRARLGLARGGGAPARRVLIVDDGVGTCGLAIDGVTGVARLPGGTLEPCPQALGSAGADLFLGIGRERDRLFLVLDLGALLRPLRRTAEARPR